MTTTTTHRICARCGRPVGILPNGRARPYVPEVTDDGVSVVCHDRSSCKTERMQRKARERT